MRAAASPSCGNSGTAKAGADSRIHIPGTDIVGVAVASLDESAANFRKAESAPPRICDELLQVDELAQRRFIQACTLDTLVDDRDATDDH